MTPDQRHSERRHEDRRKHKRISNTDRLKQIRLIHQSNHTSQGIGRDLGVGGMNILTPEHLTHGQMLKINFDLPWDLGHVETEAEVLWSKKEDINHSVGLQFHKLKPEHLKNIHRFIDEAQMDNKKSFLVKFFSIFKKIKPATST